VVLRASGDDAYNPWIWNMSIVTGHPLNSVTTILFKNSKASSNEVVLSVLAGAEAVFFAGGDQGEYMDYWVGTEVQTIVQGKVATVTIGGTSAGLAILGQWVYTAVDGSAESDEIMADPFHKHTHYLEPAFLDIPFMDSIVTDTHFGRLPLNMQYYCKYAIYAE
jgi:cyanophycinase